MKRTKKMANGKEVKEEKPTRSKRRPGETENAHTIEYPLTRKSSSFNAILILSSMLQIINLMLLVKMFYEANEKKEDLIDIYTVLGLLSMMMTIHGSFKTYNETNRTVKSMSKELKDTKDFVSKIKNTEWQRRRENNLENVKIDSSDPRKVSYERILTTGEIAIISWEIGHGEILKQLDDFYQIRESLKYEQLKLYTLIEEMRNHKYTSKELLCAEGEREKVINGLKELMLIDHIPLPKALTDNLSPWKTLSPHVTPAIDFPSKTRILHYTIIVPLFISHFLIKSLLNALAGNVQEDSAIFLTLKTLFFVASTFSVIGQSYLLNQEMVKMNLEGFTIMNGPYFDLKSLTCIGQQLTREFLFYPSNRYFNDAVEFIYSMHKFLEKLKKSPTFQLLSTDLKQNIIAIKALVKDYRDKGDYEINDRQFFGKPKYDKDYPHDDIKVVKFNYGKIYRDLCLFKLSNEESICLREEIAQNTQKRHF